MKFERANVVGYPPAGLGAGADEGAREAITVRPPFDPEKFARESDSSLRIGEQRGPASNRPTVPPPPGLPDYTSLLGVDGIPELVVAREDLEWFDLTPEARNLLQHVDGESTVSTICDKLRRPANDVIGELGRLAGEGLVSWR
jgi:hypothetical protein